MQLNFRHLQPRLLELSHSNMSKLSRHVCRTCLVQYADMTSVFVIGNFLRVSYSEIISSVTGLEVKTSDNLTTYICPKCKHDARSAYEYKTQAKKADKTLRNALTHSSEHEQERRTIDSSIRENNFKIEQKIGACGEKDDEENTDNDDNEDGDAEYVPCSYENAQEMTSYCSICGEGFDDVIKCVEHIRSHNHLLDSTGRSMGVTVDAIQLTSEMLEEGKRSLRPRKNKSDVTSCNETSLDMEKEFFDVSKPGSTTKYKKDPSNAMLTSKSSALDSDADSSVQEFLNYDSDHSNITESDYSPNSYAGLTTNYNKIPKRQINDDASVAKSRVIRNLKCETKLSNLVDDGIPSPEALDTKDVKDVFTDINISIPEVNDVENVRTVKSLNKPSQKLNKLARSLGKAHACLYCSALVKKLPRHLESKHGKEKDVIEFLQLPKGTKNRKIKIETIRQLGNYSYNCKILKGGKGAIIPKRRSKNFRDLNDMAACTNCYGLYVKSFIYAHNKHCVGVAGRKKSGGKKGSISMFAYTEKSSKFQEDVLLQMHHDAIYVAIKQDTTVLNFGRRLYNKYKTHPHRNTNVIQRMRQLGRLLIEVRTIEPDVQNISKMIHPDHFDSFVEGVKVVAGCKKNDKTRNVPILVRLLKSSIEECVAILKTDSIKITDFNRLREIDNFSNLISLSFTTAISTCKMKWNKSTTMQLANDVLKLTYYLAQQAMELTKEVTKKVTIDNWSELCDVTLVQTLTFNRCTPGEIESVLIKNYLNRDVHPFNDDILKSLNEVEKHLTEMLTMFEAPGKRVIKVPILLTKELKSQIDVLCSKRCEINIPSENPYLFANPVTSRFKLAAPILRKYAILCKAENPASITSTCACLRNHVATACQLLNLTDDEMDQLVSYMSNDIGVHRELYQWPENSLQVDKVSQLLLSLLKGNLIHKDGKNLRNINIYTNSSNEDNKEEEQAITEHQSECNTEVNIERVKKKENTVIREIKKNYSRKRKNSVQNESIQRKIVTKKTWTEKEIDAVTRQMAVFWMRKTVPNKADCDKCLENEPDLMGRTWKQIKYYVHNVIQKKKLDL